MSLWGEFRRRNVHRAALAYVAAAWLVIQVVETLTPDVLPAGTVRAAVIVVAIGFAPALVLAWFFEWTPDGFKRERDMPSGAPAAESRLLDRAIIVTLVIAVAYFAIDKFLVDPVRDEEEIEAATIEAVEDALAGKLLEKYSGRSVLVLPFLNMTADGEQEYFADGISEELLNLLAKIEELRVISRSTSWTFKDRDIDIAEIREKLKVSHILEGLVRKAGDQVRITAQLIDARTDSHLWSATYDRKLEDIFAIQDEISAEVVDRMVALAPDSSYANAWLSYFAEQEGDLQAAAPYIERALAGAADSNLYLQQAYAAGFLYRLGRVEEAAALAPYAVDRDPACTSCVNVLANTLRRAGKHREGAEELEKLLEWRDGTPLQYWHLGVGWLVAGEPAKALEYFEKAPPGNREMGRMLALHDLGRLDEFEAEFANRLSDPEQHPEGIARIAAWTGQNDLAFDYLERSIAREGVDIIPALLRGIDLYEPITADPRWRTMLERYDMADYDLAHIRFNPKLPAEVEAVLAGH